MSKIGNAGISSLHLALLVNAQHKNYQNLHSRVSHVLTLWGLEHVSHVLTLWGLELTCLISTLCGLDYHIFSMLTF